MRSGGGKEIWCREREREKKMEDEVLRKECGDKEGIIIGKGKKYRRVIEGGRK
ncbi:hypothetical protein [Ralstonia solanacearum]|uniref:hypothetical protein n=1 Tax=Ralstonia solanacearum TaxID=305 RepID=UPI000AF88113|nr:hypothetical protein [Ralstonia solanacearum]